MRIPQEGVKHKQITTRSQPKRNKSGTKTLKNVCEKPPDVRLQQGGPSTCYEYKAIQIQQPLFKNHHCFPNPKENPHPNPLFPFPNPKKKRLFKTLGTYSSDRLAPMEVKASRRSSSSWRWKPLQPELQGPGGLRGVAWGELFLEVFWTFS